MHDGNFNVHWETYNAPLACHVITGEIVVRPEVSLLLLLANKKLISLKYVQMHLFLHNYFFYFFVEKVYVFASKDTKSADKI